MSRHRTPRRNEQLDALFDDAEQIRIRLAQCDFPGAMFSLDLRGGKKGAFEFLRNLKLARNAVSLGGVETLISHPATMTHASIPREVREQIGITDGLVRISVGIEEVEDIIADLDQALAG